MELVTLCPFEVGALPWEAQPGCATVTVLVKATFSLAPGELMLAPSQDPLSEERHLEGNALASLSWPGDYVPAKRRADVMLVGSAHAPQGAQVVTLDARLAVGDMSKALRVTGDRVWVAGAAGGLERSAPAPFSRMPLRYERAALSAHNPVGLDVAAPPYPGRPALPNLELLGVRGHPCFGPISAQWRARRRLLDDAATFWAYGVARAPRGDQTMPSIGAAPARFDFGFFNAAPADQQLDLLRPGMPLVLDNLHPERARLETRLPAVRPQVFHVPPLGASRARVEEIVLRCDTLWIDTDRCLLTLTWRGLADAPLGVAGLGTMVVDADPTGAKLRWDDVASRLRGVTRAKAQDVAVQDPLAVRYDGMRDPPEAPPDPALVDEVTFDAPTADTRLPVKVEPPPRSAAPRPTPASAPRKELGIERYAAVCAELARKGADRAGVLRAHHLTEPSFKLLEAHWKKALARAEEARASALSFAYDAAYVAAQQRVGKPVGVREYARIQVAIEQGEVGRVLADLELELGDLVRLSRVWNKRLAESLELSDELELAIERAR